MNLKTQEKRLDAEFERLGIQPQVVHLMAVKPFKAVTFAYISSMNQRRATELLFYAIRAMRSYPKNFKRIGPAHFVLRNMKRHDFPGIAICDPRDKFEDLKGSVIAKGRLLKQLRQKEQKR